MNTLTSSNRTDLAASRAIPGSPLRTEQQAISTGPSIDRLLTPEDVASLLGVPRSWIYERTRLRSTDRLPGFRLGKYWRFRRADVLAWVEARR
jgi:excisionase family DNA binding protein